LAPKRRAGLTLLSLHVVAGLVYLAWAVSRLNLDAWHVTIPFAVAEALSLLAVTYYAMTIRHPRQHRRTIGAAPPELSLDIWIAVCGEPLSVVAPTVIAARAVRAHRVVVHVLDDAGSDELALLAAAHGCEYHRRPGQADAKSGNLNYALDRSSGDLILVLDADQVPDPAIMYRIGGYFRRHRIGFVQTAQKYALPDGDPWGNADALFYRIIQKSKDADDAAFSCGSGVVYRRAALESIGGFSTWNLVEDVHTSMRLHARGWRSVYHGYPLTVGTAPADVRGYVRQRSQWAVDSLRMLFWDNPFGYSGLTVAQKFQYTYTGAAYLIAAFLVPFYFLLPAWSTFTGQFVVMAPAWTYGVFRGTYLLATYLMLRVLADPVRGFKSYQFWAGMFPAFIVATVSALRSRLSKPTYRVTSKVGLDSTFTQRLRFVWPQALAVSVVVFAIPWGWIRQTLPMDALIVNGVWSAWIVWTLAPILAKSLAGADAISTSGAAQSSPDSPATDSQPANDPQAH
jgi:cellulose synthase (UDP-forming)